MSVVLCIVGMNTVSSKEAYSQAGVSNLSLAIIANKNDPESIKIARYYQAARQIPEENIIYLEFGSNLSSLTENEFSVVMSQLETQVTDNIQAYVLAWRMPWKVGCMSITSAFALGYNQEYCAESCKMTRQSDYFNSPSMQPYKDFGLRPAMLLSANTVEGVYRLIDRGVSADYERPTGSAYLLSTSDKPRNVRSILYPGIKATFNGLLPVEIIKADAIKHKKNILFYFTGLDKVRGISDNIYHFGAIADHLTSYGGKLFGGSQMSVLDWIDAGVTGSYGGVVEPCNFAQKFPNPGVVMQNYLQGSTLIEAYWKSVKMPGQGLFVGEPLAAPFKGCKVWKNRQGKIKYMNQAVENYVEKRSRSCN